MEIHGNNRAKELANLLFGVQDSSPSQQAERRQADAKSDSVRSDTVSISLEGRNIQRLADLVKAEDPRTAERAAEIKRAIENGTYHVDGQSVADALLHNVLVDSVL